MDINWNDLFAVSVPPLELVIRGTVIYWFLVLVFRTILRRDVSAVGIADILLLVIVADAAQNAMAGESSSVSDGLILICTILGWNIVLDWLAYAVPALRHVVQPRELLLVRDGKVLHRSLRKELMTEAELWAKLREHGIDDLREVRAAYMERDGAVSVLRRRTSAPSDYKSKSA
jgi:uncharacterized membrane protein YcaP (DUF421 family)